MAVEIRTYQPVHMQKLQQLERVAEGFETLTKRLSFNPQEIKFIQYTDIDAKEHVIPVDGQFNFGLWFLINRSYMRYFYSEGLGQEAEDILRGVYERNRVATS